MAAIMVVLSLAVLIAVGAAIGWASKFAEVRELEDKLAEAERTIEGMATSHREQLEERTRQERRAINERQTNWTQRYRRFRAEIHAAYAGWSAELIRLGELDELPDGWRWAMRAGSWEAEAEDERHGYAVRKTRDLDVLGHQCLEVWSYGQERAIEGAELAQACEQDDALARAFRAVSLERFGARRSEVLEERLRRPDGPELFGDLPNRNERRESEAT